MLRKKLSVNTQKILRDVVIGTQRRGYRELLKILFYFLSHQFS